jgi:excisionase family DNA binding protein
MKDAQLNDRLIDAETAAYLSDIKPETWRKWGREGKIPVVKIGRSVRFRISDIEKLIRK